MQNMTSSPPSAWSTQPVAPLRPGLLLLVVGARGGAGATTLAALLAAALASRTATALVDLAGGPGLDVALGIETLPGPRWPDLAGAGDVPGDQVLAALPRWGQVAVVSADRARPSLPPPRDVLDRLREAAGVVVLDVPTCDVLAGRAPVDRADLVVVVAGRDVASVAGAVALRTALGPLAARAAVVASDARRGPLGLAELEQATRLPLLGRVPYDRTVAQSAERGVVRARRATTRVPDSLAGTVLGLR
ncbi:MAG: pilus assembly protein FlpE [Micrococcales bacterium]|nr:pilus assembly protein FlpE [Micrococcales bacterium]